jgi:dTDP-3,4-didehydro-2,6-dideoxy-alpha-D-glucose 3-reductase
MKVLLLGYSSIGRRRVIPALRKLGAESVDVASFSKSAPDSPGDFPIRMFGDYDQALKQTDAEVVYVSTVNSQHAVWARMALQLGFHVVVDKPAFPTVALTQELIELADRNELCLAEATVYAFHPWIAAARSVFEQAGVSPTHLLAAFTYPPVAANNYRNFREPGGGALWDLGPYAITPGRLFFDSQPAEIVGRRLSENAEVDTSFSMIALYPDGRSCAGSFGFTTGYLNRLDIVGPKIAMTVDRAFVPPPDAAMELVVREPGRVQSVQVPCADSFALFFEDLFRKIATRNYGDYRAAMLQDALALERLRMSALASPIA